MFQEATHLLGALLEHLLSQLRVLHRRGRPRGLPPQELVAEQHGRRRQVGGGVLHHLVVNERELQEVLCKVAVRLCATVHALVALHEVHGRGPADLEVQHGEHGDLHLQHLLLGVGLVRDVDKVVDLRGVQLLELRRNQQRRDADELQVPPQSAPPLQEAVDEADGQEEGLGPELVLLVHVHEPVDQDGPHLGVHVRLAVHVARLRQALVLVLVQLLVDVRRVLHDVLRVLCVHEVGLNIALSRWRGSASRACVAGVTAGLGADRAASRRGAHAVALQLVPRGVCHVAEHGRGRRRGVGHPLHCIFGAAGQQDLLCRGARAREPLVAGAPQHRAGCTCPFQGPLRGLLLHGVRVHCGAGRCVPLHARHLQD
mmetsp:Transcript_49608/g.158716  ORF Transcript_49608/g.158716 Transcript_49608/m.158716 type:complete len:371 (-) Transcript_49608:136-1248(-)